MVDLDLEFRVGIDQVENNLKIFSNCLAEVFSPLGAQSLCNNDAQPGVFFILKSNLELL